MSAPPSANPHGSSAWEQFRHRHLPTIVFAAVILLTVLLWQRQPGHSSIVARAEAVRSSVTTINAGVVVALPIDLLQRVKKGDVVAQVVALDAEATRAQFTADLESLRAQMLQGAERNTVNNQQLRLDWLRRSSELASARVELQLAESEVQRYQSLHATKVVSEAEFEMRRSNRDGLRSKVSALERLVSDLQIQADVLEPTKTTEVQPAARAIAAAITAAQKQLEAQTEMALLRAPMDGVVTAILRRPGENATAGESLATVSAVRPTRIVAYVRQPLNLRLKVGDLVNVSGRTAGHQSLSAKVLQVGTQLEAIDPSLLPLSTFRVIEYGLPLLIEIPAGLALMPGESVTVTPASK